MKARIVKPGDLDPAHIALWREFQDAEPALQSPFFSVEFTAAIGAARSDAYVAILEDGGRVCGFLPFHRCRAGIAKPIGGPISDYQGVIAAPGFDWTGEALLKACGLNAYDFNHAPENQSALYPGAIHYSRSPYIDLSEGFDAYIEARLRSSRKNLKDLDRRRRKIEREIGPLHFHYSDGREETWRRLVAMKNQSYERLKVRSILDVAWVDRALAALRATSNEHFAGLMTSIFAGERLIAGHFGMRSKTTWCWWFNSYDYDVRNYAPGMLLVLEAAKRAPAEGLTKIDFGRGDADYKLVFSTAETRLCEGSIELASSRAGTLRRAQKFCVGVAKGLPLGRYESYPRRALARLLTSMRLPHRGAAR